jgi:hypothetical protein
MIVGARGLAGAGSLARFLARHRGARNHMAVPPLTVGQVLAWADAHHARAGTWPTRSSGPIPEAAGEAWSAVDAALVVGARGLPGGDSLARLLARERGARNPADVPPLTVRQILAWADAHHARRGSWPTAHAGPVPGVPNESWGAINMALYKGRRGLRGGDSLAKLLERHRGVRRWARQA